MKQAKYCGKCRLVKPTTEYHKRTASPDGLSGVCKPCAKKYGAWYRAKYPRTTQHLAKQKEYNDWYRDTFKDSINTRRRTARAEVRRIETIRGYR